MLMVKIRFVILKRERNLTLLFKASFRNQVLELLKLTQTNYSFEELHGSHIKLALKILTITTQDSFNVTTHLKPIFTSLLLAFINLIISLLLLVLLDQAFFM